MNGAVRPRASTQTRHQVGGLTLGMNYRSERVREEG